MALDFKVLEDGAVEIGTRRPMLEQLEDEAMDILRDTMRPPTTVVLGLAEYRRLTIELQVWLSKRRDLGRLTAAPQTYLLPKGIVLSTGEVKIVVVPDPSYGPKLVREPDQEWLQRCS